MKQAIQAHPKLESIIGILVLFFLAGTINAQTIEVSPDSIKELIYQPKSVKKDIKINNLSTDSILHYDASIQYVRTPKEIVIQDSLLVDIAKEETYTQQIQYVDTAFLSDAYGSSDSYTRVATKFRSGASGFNISDIGTWFISEDLQEGSIQVEVYAGGTSINDAILVSTISVDFQLEEKIIHGNLYNIHLETPIGLYPNEDFYLAFTFPESIKRPQGCAINERIDPAPGRYWVYQNNQWQDLQKSDRCENASWIMYVAERAPKNTSWLSVKHSDNSILPDSHNTLQVTMEGNLAKLGSQSAYIHITSNDTITPTLSIPVEFRLNEAPYFLNYPTEVFLKEEVAKNTTIDLIDYEGNDFFIEPVMGCKFVQFEDEGTKLILKAAPKLGDIGEYFIIFKATDSAGSSREMKIKINVLANEAPEFFNLPGLLTLKEASELEVTINASDPENDLFTISLAEKSDFIRFSHEGQNIKITISPKIGDAGDHSIKFYATDVHGLRRETTLDISVLPNEAPEFFNLPGLLTLKEASELEVTINATDPENDLFTISLAEKSDFIRFSHEGQNIKIIISPKIGDAGDHSIKFYATDVHGLRGETTLNITILPNEAPVFINPPVEIFLEEEQISEITVEVKDPENDSFKIDLSDNYGFVTYSINNSSVTFHIAPKTGHVGDFNLNCIVTDEHGLYTETVIVIHVLHKNRPPVFIGNEDVYIYSFWEDSFEQNIHDWFMDPDGESFKFEVSSRSTRIAEVSVIDANTFRLIPKTTGSTKLDFILTDARGGVAVLSVDIFIGKCENPQEIIVQKWNKVLLINNRYADYAPDGYQWFKNGLPIIGATSQYYSSEDDTGTLLDFQSEYYARMVTTTGDTIYTCPMTPIQENVISVKTYPNPVVRGMYLTVEIESDISSNPGKGNVTIVDITGNVLDETIIEAPVSQIKMPNMSGIYIVKVNYTNGTNVFRVKVE